MTKHIEISELAQRNGLGPHPEADARADDLDKRGLNVRLLVTGRKTLLTATGPELAEPITEIFYDE